MIRVAPLGAHQDAVVLGLAHAMKCEAPHYRDYPFETEKLREWIKLCREHESWLCVIAWDGEAPIGFMAVGAVEMLFCRELIIEDLALFVIHERRGSSAALRLLRYAEGWATGRAREIRIGITTGTRAKLTERFLERLGYSRCGVLMHKSL